MPRKLTIEEVKQWAEENTDAVVLSEQYVNSGEKLLFQCSCDKQFERRWDHFKHKEQFKCLACSPEGTPKKTTEHFIADMQEVHGDSITVLGEYIGAFGKIAVQCNSCSHQWNPVANDLIHRKNGCPNCSSSKGEKAVAKCLTELNCYFQQQYRFSDCRNKKPLPFDFAVTDAIGIPLFLIEYDGQQHFEAVDYFGGEATLQRTQQNDRKKTDYCKANCIPLLRISYQQQDQIEQLVTDAVQKYCPQEMAV